MVPEQTAWVLAGEHAVLPWLAGKPDFVVQRTRHDAVSGVIHAGAVHYRMAAGIQQLAGCGIFVCVGARHVENIVAIEPRCRVGGPCWRNQETVRSNCCRTLANACRRSSNTSPAPDCGNVPSFPIDSGASLTGESEEGTNELVGPLAVPRAKVNSRCFGMAMVCAPSI